MKSNLILSFIFCLIFSCGYSQSADITWEISLSEDGDRYYSPGETIEFSITCSNFDFGVPGLPHGFSFEFPEVYDLSSLTILANPFGCGLGGGSWYWYNSVSGYGPGFFYDSFSGGGGLGDPSSNWGDCLTEYTFSISLSLTTACEPGSTFDGVDISPTLLITSDGATGSWGAYAPPIEDTFNTDLLRFTCCESDLFAGYSQSDTQICQSENICLIDFVSGEVTPNEGGVWTGPNGWTSSDYCGTFDPVSDPEGTYFYTLGSEECVRQAFVQIAYDLQPELEFYRPCSEITNLFDAICEPNSLPVNGIWYYPHENELNLEDTVDLGIVHSETAPNGKYTYIFQDDNGCFQKVQIELDFNPENLGVLESTMLCDQEFELGEIIDSDNSYPVNGDWYFESIDESNIVVDGLIDQAIHQTGDYIYVFEDEYGCDFSMTVPITMLYVNSPGVETEIEFCSDVQTLCPFDRLDGNPDEGGTWLISDSDGNFIAYYPNFNPCFALNELPDQFVCTYIIGSTTCNNTYSTDLIVYKSFEPCNTNMELAFDFENSNPSCEEIEANIWIRTNETGELVFASTDYQINGETPISLDLSPGVYDVFIKLDGYLSKGILGVTLEPGVQTIELEDLHKGDINGDDVINIIDISSMNSGFGTQSGEPGYYAELDMNCDGTINIIDISMINPGYNLSGEFDGTTE